MDNEEFGKELDESLQVSSNQSPHSNRESGEIEKAKKCEMKKEQEKCSLKFYMWAMRTWWQVSARIGLRLL